jgi:hypothetical protein
MGVYVHISLATFLTCDCDQVSSANLDHRHSASMELNWPLSMA